MSPSSIERLEDRITVYVGPKKKVRYISKKAFAKLELNIDLEYITQYSIPDWSIELFGHLAFWLKEGHIKPFESKHVGQSQAESDAADKLRLFQYLDLYQKAEEWGAEVVQNAIVDRIKARATCEKGYFSVPFIQKLYTVTTDDSPLRRYVADSFVWKAADWEVSDIRVKLGKHMNRGNQTFVLDCYEALGHQIHRSNMKYPNDEDDCAYHAHDSTVNCTEKSGKKRKREGSTFESENSIEASSPNAGTSLPSP